MIAVESHAESQDSFVHFEPYVGDEPIPRAHDDYCVGEIDELGEEGQGNDGDHHGQEQMPGPEEDDIVDEVPHQERGKEGQRREQDHAQDTGDQSSEVGLEVWVE